MSLRRNPPPVETPMARHGMIEAYKALRVLDESGDLDVVAEVAHDIKAVEQAREAIATLEMCMSPNLLCTILPAYTKVAFLTDKSREGAEPQEGLLREGAWGLFPNRGESCHERRSTTTSGFEFFVTPETDFTYFEVLDRPEVKR